MTPWQAHTRAGEENRVVTAAWLAVVERRVPISDKGKRGGGAQHRTNKIWLFKPVLFTRLTPVRENKCQSKCRRSIQSGYYLYDEIGNGPIWFNSLYFHMAYM